MVDAPAEAAWQLLRDIERWPRWTPTVTAVQRKDTGAFLVGSSALVHQPGQPPRLWTVTDIEEGKSFTWMAGNRALTFTGDHLVEDRDGGTVVTVRFTLSGPLSRVAALVAGKRIRRTIGVEVMALKQWCESGH
ncbi:Polyketide cyclase / dehydrase and lipid transport [Nocardia cyriacigeorgica]|uniref:Polyketide cyclase / dehydrase and lipid transport n=1 Tax=Nocardia cyriacigeorgica TaxID=135487 RepID=A0A4U8VWL2_9NOCA|nr:Polyketide cyclase / dehydrase and lipid transport [Nocardia cyriacigeorgica]